MFTHVNVVKFTDRESKAIPGQPVIELAQASSG